MRPRTERNSADPRSGPQPSATIDPVLASPPEHRRLAHPSSVATTTTLSTISRYCDEYECGIDPHQIKRTLTTRDHSPGDISDSAALVGVEGLTARSGVWQAPDVQAQGLKYSGWE